MKNYFLLFIFLNSIFVFSQRILELKTDYEKASYAIGLSLAQNFMSQGLDKDINLDIIKQALRNKFENKKLLFSEDSIQSFIADYMLKRLEKVGEKKSDENEVMSNSMSKIEREGILSNPKDQKLSFQEILKLKTDDEKAAYAIGLELARNFKIQGFDKDLDINIMKQAMQDKFENKELLFSEDSIQSFMSVYIHKHLEKVSKRNANKSKKFLDENKKKSGVKTTASGLQYKVEKEGTGAKPTDEDLVSVHYVLKTTDGSVIEDSKNKPVDLPLSRVVKGWKEGVKLMSKGAKYTLYVPADLAYGENGPAGPNQALIFEIELIDFKPMPKQEAQEQ